MAESDRNQRHQSGNGGGGGQTGEGNVGAQPAEVEAEAGTELDVTETDTGWRDEPGGEPRAGEDGDTDQEVPDREPRSPCCCRGGEADDGYQGQGAGIAIPEEVGPGVVDGSDDGNGRPDGEGSDNDDDSTLSRENKSCPCRRNWLG